MDFKHIEAFVWVAEVESFRIAAEKLHTTQPAISQRIAALESSKDRAKELYPDIEKKNEQQMLAYSEMPDDELFATQWVRVEIGPEEMPGYKAARVTCDACGTRTTSICST